MKLASPLLCFLLGGGMLLAGCSMAPKLGGVTVSIAGIRPAGAAAGHDRAILTLRFTSENVNAIAFSASTHKLYLNGSYVGKAESDQPIGLQPLVSVTQDVTVIFENPAVVRQAMATHDRPPASYRLESVLRFFDNEEKFQFKSQSDGSLSLQALEGTIR
jgi:LEA14-like dessication related protein